ARRRASDVSVAGGAAGAVWARSDASKRESMGMKGPLRESAPGYGTRSADGQAPVEAECPACYPTRPMDRPQLSVVIPLFNEEENVQPLLDELFGELAKLGRSH